MMAREQVRLGELLSRRPLDVRVDPNVEYQFAGVYSFGRGVFRSLRKRGSEFSYKQLTRLRAGEFTYPKLMAWEGALGVVPAECDGCVVSPEFPVFEIATARLVPAYLDHYFRRAAVWPSLAGGSGGTNLRRQRLDPEAFLSLEIELPPVAEQRRIVDRIDALARKVQDARDLHGMSVKEAQLLREKWLDRTFDPNRGELASYPLRELGELVIDVADGPHVTPDYTESGIPFVTVLNISSGELRFNGAKFIDAAQHEQFRRRAAAERGDVLLSKDGSIGIPCYIDTDVPFSFFVSVALIKPRRDVLDGRYLSWALRSPGLQDMMRANARGDMIRHLVLREIRRLRLPIPPLDVQARIVSELEDRNSRFGSLSILHGVVRDELDTLMSAALERAFRGEM